MKAKEQKYVLVTTSHRGVFAGYGPTEPDAQGRITLTDARMCVYWPAECKGVLGLAAVGPLKGSRISPAVPSLTLTDTTSVTEVSDDAKDLWQSAPWS